MDDLFRTSKRNKQKGTNKKLSRYMYSTVLLIF